MIACGGTGGHLFPGIAVAEALVRRGHAALLLISGKEIDSLAAGGHGDLEFRKLPAIAMGRVLSWNTVRFLAASWSGYRECRRLIAGFEATTVLGMGGFTSSAPILAGRLMGRRTFIHESNAIPGKANRLTARFCDAVLLGLEDCAVHFGGRPTRVVGTPVRSSFHRPVDRQQAVRDFGLDPGRRTLLVMGGSQGARAVNRMAREMLGNLAAGKVQVIHIAGPGDYEEVRRSYQEATLKSAVMPFLSEMERAYAVADLAISRAGASSLAELAFFGLPAILIPYPYAAGEHQKRNAQGFSNRGAAILAEEGQLTGAKLAGMVNELFSDDARLSAMAASARKLASPEAAEEICKVIEQWAR